MTEMSGDEVIAVENGHQNGVKPADQNGVSVEKNGVETEQQNGEVPAKRPSEDSAVPDEPPTKKSKTDGEDEAMNEEPGQSKPVEQPSPVPDDPDVKIVDDKPVEPKKEVELPDVKDVKKDEKSSKKEPELTSSGALLNKLEEYVDSAMEKNENVDRKVLDALLAAINIQVQREPLSVRKLILEKQLVLPNTISFPPSQVVDLLIEHDPDHPLQKVIQRMFPDEKPKLSENEKKERQMLKQNFGAPHMTKLLMDIGQDLVQEATYCDIVHARNLPEVPKNIDTYKQVAAQLKPVWESLKKKNEPYKLKQISCHLCGFKTESRIIMIKHRSTPHFDGKKYQCTMCPEFDTNESRMFNHYVEAHFVIPTKEEPPLRNPCHICDEDFQLKGQREAHFKMCKRDFHRLRHIMSPKNPDDMSHINRWLWDKPPVDPTILAQQQVAQQQQLKQARAAQMAAAPQTNARLLAAQQARAGMTAHLQNAQLQHQQHQQHQQQILNQQRLQRQLMLQQQQQAQQTLASMANSPRQQNALIAAMQQHLQQSKAGAAARQQANPITAANAALLQKALQQKMQFQAQQHQQAQAAANLLAAAGKLQNQQNGKQQGTPTSSPVVPRPVATPSGGAATSSGGGLICEICDNAQRDKDSYLVHLQSQHRQLKQKSSADMQQGAPLACSRCRDRFWTYEGLERHLVMSHGLVTSDLLAKAQKKEDGGRCKLCSKQYAFNMLQHLVADHQVKLCSAEIMYSCDVCSFKCQSYQKLEEHLTKTHPKTGNGTPAAAPPKKITEECITLDD